MKASIGRIVHYVSTEGNHDAAIVLRVYPEGLYLEVMGPVAVGFKFREAVQEDPGGAPGTWHWPEREE